MAAQAVLILEKNCHFIPLKQKLAYLHLDREGEEGGRRRGGEELRRRREEEETLAEQHGRRGEAI